MLLKVSSAAAKLPFGPGAGTFLIDHIVAKAMSAHRVEKARGIFRQGASWNGAYHLQRGLFMPWELKGLLEPEFLEEGLSRYSIDEDLGPLVPLGGGDFVRMACLEQQHYMKNQLLRDADWAGMAHSLEIRVPFVDHVFIRKTLTSIIRRRDPHRPKSLLVDACARLPIAVANRGKSGFSVPMENWFIERSGGSAVNERRPWQKRWALHVLASKIHGVPLMIGAR